MIDQAGKPKYKTKMFQTVIEFIKISEILKPKKTRKWQ
jgi:hypothetical protein